MTPRPAMGRQPPLREPFSSTNCRGKLLDEMEEDRPRCEWCRHLLKPKGRGRPAHYCSASCRQLSYERRQLVKQRQAKADAINKAKFPAWATHLHVRPKMPLRHRPRQLKCPVCTFRFPVKARGPIPETCGRRCSLALTLRNTFKLGVNKPIELLDKDISEAHLIGAQRRRYQAIVDALVAPPAKKTKR